MTATEEVTPIFQPYIDSTMRSCFVSCPHKWFLEFCLGLRPGGISIDLHAGACFASALEHIGKRVHTEKVPLDEALRSAHAEYLMNWGDVVPTKDTPKTRDRVWQAVYNEDGASDSRGYFQVYPPMTDHVQPYFVDGRPTFEFTFAEPLDYPNFPRHPLTGDPFIYSGRFDMLGQWNGRPIIRDEKTTTSLSANWSNQWQLRAQLLGYVWACRRLGIDIDTVCIRGVGILKTKFHQVEAMITFADWEVERWLCQLARDIRRMVDCWNLQYWDYNLGETCNSYGGCQFQDVCRARNEEAWYDRYVVKRWNPLLKNPTAEEGTTPCQTPASGPSSSGPLVTSPKELVTKFLNG